MIDQAGARFMNLDGAEHLMISVDNAEHSIHLEKTYHQLGSLGIAGIRYGRDMGVGRWINYIDRVNQNIPVFLDLHYDVPRKEAVISACLNRMKPPRPIATGAFVDIDNEDKINYLRYNCPKQVKSGEFIVRTLPAHQVASMQKQEAETKVRSVTEQAIEQGFRTISLPGLLLNVISVLREDYGSNISIYATATRPAYLSSTEYWNGHTPGETIAAGADIAIVEYHTLYNNRDGLFQVCQEITGAKD